MCLPTRLLSALSFALLLGIFTIVSCSVTPEPAAAAAATTTPLHDALRRVEFLNNGTTTASDNFHWETLTAIGQGQRVIYLEADNVSCTECVWSDGGKYYSPHPYLFKESGSNAGKNASISSSSSDNNKPGVYNGQTPASGIRSAIPLGGIGAGSVELRGDGTLHEWTIHNAAPCCAAKIQQYLDSPFALRIGGVSRVLQTHPDTASSSGAASVMTGKGVKAIRYSGAYPVSRLDILDDALAGPNAGILREPASLFGYSSFSVSDLEASARPLAAFTVALEAGTAVPATGTNAGFFFQLPHLIEHDQARRGTPLRGDDVAAAAAATASTVVACAHACRANGNCHSWVFESGSCTLQSDAPHNVYALGVVSGLPGTWTVDSSAPHCMTLERPGVGPMHGNMTLCAAAEGLAGSELKFSGYTSDDPAGAFQQFASASSTTNNAAASATAATATAAAAKKFTPLGNADYNSAGKGAVLVDGTSNIKASVADCEAQCQSIPACMAGLFLNGTVRHGECWLDRAVSTTPRRDFCGRAPGQSCFAFGVIPPPPPPAPPVPPPAPGYGGLYGAISIGGTLMPGANATLTITMGWNFPHRDHFNYAAASPATFTPFGNQYARLYPTAATAAFGNVPPKTRANALALDLLKPIGDFHTALLGAGASSVPEYLRDLMVNSLSHTRDSMWWQACPHCHVSADPRVNGSAGKGFFRQYEAFDCIDIDSIHNDGERHMPYILYQPFITRSKLAAWAGTQGQDGMLAEEINQNDPDLPEGRIMSDSTSMFVLYLLELLRWNGDEVSARLYYATAKRGIEWHLSRAQELGVPKNLETTYDIMQFPKYDVSTYTSIWQIAVLKAGEVLATFNNDTDFASVCAKGAARAQQALDTMQWTGTHYAAASNGCSAGKACTQQVGVFSDAFYAQVLAYGLGLGDLLLDPTRLDAHLETVEAANCMHVDVRDGNGNYSLVPGCPYGLITMTGRAPPGVSDQQVWQMATNDHAALSIWRASPSTPGSATKVAAALELARGPNDAWRRVVNDQWNIAGISLTDARPSITSHYGYHMTLWHLPKALSGQMLDLTYPGKRSLTFEPRVACPFDLPVLMVSRLASVSCAAGSSGGKPVFTLNLISGEPLHLDVLAVGAVRARGPVTLTVGKPYSWST